MALRQRAVTGTMVLGMGQIAILGCRFVRNVIIARLLTKTDYGIAATFALTIMTLEQMASLSIDKLVVQAREGEDPAFQATAHSLQLARAALMTLVLWSTASPIARLFDVPDAVWAFRWLSLVPLLQGFVHLDIYRMQRDMRIWPRVLVEAAPQAVITLLAWPVTVWLKDYSSVLWLTILGYLFTVAGSHVVAQRPFRVGVDKGYAKSALAFAWPLLLSTLLMFFVQQGDRYFVGAAYPMEEFAAYTLAASLVMVFQGLAFKVIDSIMLPLLSGVQDSPDRFEQRYRLCVQAIFLGAAAMGSLFILAGRLILVTIYGAKYEAATLVLGWMATSQACRLIRVAPTLGAFAAGDTKCTLFANIVRSAGLPLALLLAYLRFDIHWVAIAGVLGELPAIVYAVYRLADVQGMKKGIAFATAAVPVGAIALSWMLYLGGMSEARAAFVVPATGAVLLLTLGAGLAAYPQLRRETVGFAGSVLRRGGLRNMAAASVPPATNTGPKG